MTRGGRPAVVVLGMMTKMPVAGVVWQTLHYLLGFERLGYDAYYVETHGRTPSMLMEHAHDDGAGRAAAFIATIMRRVGLADRWAYHALHDDGRRFGMSDRELRRVYGSAAMLLDLHGGTEPLEDIIATDRLVYLETDPVQLQFELAGGYQPAIDFLEPHCAFFTFAENYGGADCGLPVSDRYRFQPTRQPVVLDLWQTVAPPGRRTFTTIGNWRQEWRDVDVDGDTYTWSKHHEFERFLETPRRVGERFELGLASYTDGDRRMLEERGWQVAHALSFSMDLHGYRRYIADSYGEFTAAKDQNVRLRTGWFSDRSATYLAAGRPVITQDTGFGAALPTGEGLFAFSSIDDVAEAVKRIDADPERHRRAARDIARDYFSHEVVLGELLEHLGMGAPARTTVAERPRLAFPFGLVIEPVSRRPTTLPDETIATVLGSPLPDPRDVAHTTSPEVSIVVVSYDSLVFTRLCLETVLANSGGSVELIVVDNASSDGTPDYLRRVASADPRVRVIANDHNAGFPRACNQGLEAARGDVFVLLNSDTMVAPGWLDRLLAPVSRDAMTLCGPVTNRIGNEAEVVTGYATWGGYLREARLRAHADRGKAFEIPTLTMFCLAMSRSAHEQIGPLDVRYGLGTLEDDDYSMRAKRAGCRLLCVEDALVHHFGEGSFGKLYRKGEYGRIIGRNRDEFERKWGEPWQPYARRAEAAYAELVDHVRERLAEIVPPGGTVLVLSYGDPDLLAVEGRRAWHFPRDDRGEWAGFNPADSAEAIARLEALRQEGARYLAVPRPAFWWLDFYEGFTRRLDGAVLHRDESLVVFDTGPLVLDVPPSAEETHLNG